MTINKRDFKAMIQGICDYIIINGINSDWEMVNESIIKLKNNYDYTELEKVNGWKSIDVFDIRVVGVNYCFDELFCYVDCMNATKDSMVIDAVTCAVKLNEKLKCW